MASIITSLLNGSLSKNDSQNRYIETNANLKSGAFLFDFSFVVPDDYSNKWNFLRDVYVNIVLRLGTTNGGAVPLVSDVPVYDLLNLSDYEAGCSMRSTDFTAGEQARISGLIDNGFFIMSANDALEVSLTVADKTSFPSSAVNFQISSVYTRDELQHFVIYKDSKPTGADMPYKNVVAVYYTGTDVKVEDGVIKPAPEGGYVNKNCSIQDMLGAKPVNIEDAIAYSNAAGNFEFFTRFGLLYKDPYDFSQDITIRCPTDDPKATLLIKQYAFYPELLSENTADSNSEKISLLTKIRNSDPEKYSYLELLGRM